MAWRREQLAGMGLHIEGILTSTSEPEGIAYRYGHAPDSSDFSWVEGLLEVPAQVAHSVDPYTGVHDISSHTFRLALQHAPELWAQGEVVATLAADLTSGQMQVAAGVLSEGDIVYIGDETMQVGALASTANGIDTWGVFQGRARSGIGDYVAGAAVYRGGLPRSRRRGRLVTLYELRDTGENEVAIWTGAIVATRLHQLAGYIELICDEYLSVLARRQLNRKAQALDVAGLSLGPFSATGVVALPAGHTPAVPGAARAYVQIEDVVVSLDVGAGSYSTPTGTWRRYLGEAGTWTEDPAGVSAWEVLYANAREGVTSFEDIDDPWNPVAVCLALVLSTGRGNNDPISGRTSDVLARRWGLAVPVSRIDEDAWEAAIAQTADIEIEQFYAGFDGAEFDAWSWIRETLRALGYFLAPSLTGDIGPRRYGPPTVDDLAAIVGGDSAWLYPEEVLLDMQEERAIGLVSASVGETPWGGASTLEYIEPYIESPTRVEADAGLVLANQASPQTFRVPWLYRSSVDRADRLMWERFADRRDAPVMATCTVSREHPQTAPAPSAGALPALGAYVRLYTDDLFEMLGADGTDQALSGLAAIGQVLSVDLDYQAETATVGLALWGYLRPDLGRLIAPGAVTVSASGADLTVVETGDAITAGDELVLTDEHDREHDGVLYTCTARVGSVLTLSPSPPNVAGLYVRLADVDDYDNATWTGAALAPDGRRWAYVADASGLLGAGDDAGDRWS
jgi:hypothetical protein